MPALPSQQGNRVSTRIPECQTLHEERLVLCAIRSHCCAVFSTEKRAQARVWQPSQNEVKNTFKATKWRHCAMCLCRTQVVPTQHTQVSEKPFRSCTGSDTGLHVVRGNGDLAIHHAAGMQGTIYVHGYQHSTIGKGTTYCSLTSISTVPKSRCQRRWEVMGDMSKGVPRDITLESIPSKG
jgi:hypothetical protein